MERIQFLCEAMDATLQPFIAGYYDGRLITFNDAYCELTGYARDELLNSNWYYILTPPEWREKERFYFEEIHRTGKPQRYEKEYIRKDGVRISIEVFRHLAVDSMGNHLFYYSFVTDITERKRVEKALRKSESNMARAQRAAHLGNWEWDLRTNLLFCSDEHYRMYGLEPGDYPVDTFINLVHPDDRQYVQDSLAVALNEGKPYDVECRIVRPDGSVAVLHGEGEVTYDENGRPACMFGIAQDITERKKAEESFARGRELFQRIVDTIPVMITIFDPNVDRFYLNWACRQVLGLTDEDAVRGNLMEVVYPDPEYRQMVIEYMQSTVPGWKDLKATAKDGSIVDSSWSNIRLSDNTMVGIGVDIRERKKAEEDRDRLLKDIDEQRSRLQAILDSLPVGVIIADATGRIVQINDMVRRVWGDASMCGNVEVYAEYPGWRADTGELIKANEWALARAVTRGKTIVGEVIDIQRFDGKRSTVLNSAAPVKDSSGNIIGGVVTLQDISHRRQMEKDLSDARAQAELYLDLLGHDINNMHQIMYMQLELAQMKFRDQGMLKSEDIELIDTPLETLERSSNLIQNVRMLRKARDGECSLESIDLGTLLDDVVRGYSKVPGRDVTIKYMPEYGKFVRASPLIKDVLINLVDNAIKHSGDPVVIGADVSRVEQKGISYYSIAIEDNGKGIPDEKKEIIFQRFKRGETVTRGVGLGLYIAKTLVESFDGDIVVEDRVKGDHRKGARFIVYLPVEEHVQ